MFKTSLLLHNFCLYVYFVLVWFLYFYTQKGGDLTQSYDKSPYTNRKVKGAKKQHKQRHKKVRLNNNCGPT